MKKTLLIIAGIILLGAVLVLAREYYQEQHLQGPDAPESTSIEDIEDEETIVINYDSLNIEMDFYAQAPHGNWDYPWQEACEEASVLLIANEYLEMNLGLEDFNTELLRLVDWEIDYFGAYEHTSIDQTAEMMETQYELETNIHEDPSFEDIQEILNEGHLIIAPFAGKLLGNPNYRNGGPIYHMLVIKGYDAAKEQIVTHDVGTKNGADYVYSWKVIENALHDWHDDDILLGDKKIIEVLPPSS